MVRRPLSKRPGSISQRAILKQLLVPLVLMALALLLLIGLPHPAAAQSAGSSILIWPVGPTIEADDRAAALWLENPGKAPVTLQIRIFAWTQEGGQNSYASQDEILGTPPIATIAPGGKQLVRLTRTGVTPPGREAAYRVVVDEIPIARPAVETGAAVNFRMRYSLPLFAYGEGLAPLSSISSAKRRQNAPRSARSPSGEAVAEDISALPASNLDWRIAETREGRFLEIRNRGALHARLTDVAFAVGRTDGLSDSGSGGVAKGLLGYVLPGATMRWPLAPSARVSDTLLVAVDGAIAAPVPHRTD